MWACTWAWVRHPEGNADACFVAADFVEEALDGGAEGAGFGSRVLVIHGRRHVVRHVEVGVGFCRRCWWETMQSRMHV